MGIDHDLVQLRRYVLGVLTADECEAIEHDYFERADLLDQVGAAEDELIDDYLSDRLASPEREQFERYFLATPNHRRRVAVMRAIRSASSALSSQGSKIAETSTADVTGPLSRRGPVASWWSMTIAASLVMLVAAGTWIIWPRSEGDTAAIQSPAAPASPSISPTPNTGEPAPRQSVDPSRETAVPSPSSPPVVVAVTISPVLVRGASESAAITIGTNTDIVRIQMRGEPGEGLDRGRAVIRTVAGREVWRGPVSPMSGSPRQALARVDVPAPTLQPDDYIVELFGTGVAGREVERYRYFLRVQRP